MALHTRLLPQNATPLMLAAAEANDPFVRLADSFDAISHAYRNTPPAFMPYLIWQYGLGELTPYLPNLYELVRQGLRWQRVRGTPKAIAKGLEWLGYGARIEEDPTRRRKWNRFQIELNRLRDADLPDLSRIDGIVSLSPPARSVFYRGFRGYDVRAAETAHSRLSRAILSSHSGVQINPGKAKWSFGRHHSADRLLSQADLTALDAWIPPVPDTGHWRDASFGWSSGHFQWAVPAVAARRKAIAETLSAKTAYLCFKTANGDVIGYRRAIIRAVRQHPGGEYQVGASQWTADAERPEAIIVSGLSGFGDGAGHIAATISIAFDPTLAAQTPAGRLWLSPAEATGGTIIAETNIPIPLGLTVRELCRFSLRF